MKSQVITTKVTPEDLEYWRRHNELPAHVTAPRPTSSPAPVAVKAKARQPKQRGRMNKTEARYADLLEAKRQAGEIASWRYEAVQLRLADRTTYTPDFWVVTADGTVQCHEVKGSWSAPHQEDARVKLKMAAEVWRELQFVAAVVDKGGFALEWFE